MPFIYDGKTEQHQASIRRQDDARVLRANRRWRGAMYLYGYVLECRLKARLMEQFGAFTLQELEETLTIRMKKEVDVKTHRIEYLYNLLSVKGSLIDPRGNDKNLKAYRLCNLWTVAWRYRPDEGTEDECQDFFDAVDLILHFIEHNS